MYMYKIINVFTVIYMYDTYNKLNHKMVIARYMIHDTQSGCFMVSEEEVP